MSDPAPSAWAQGPTWGPTAAPCELAQKAGAATTFYLGQSHEESDGFLIHVYPASPEVTPEPSGGWFAVARHGDDMWVDHHDADSYVYGATDDTELDERIARLVSIRRARKAVAGR